MIRCDRIFEHAGTVSQVPDRVGFRRENVHLLANHNSAFLTGRAVIGQEDVYIFMPKSDTFRNFDGIAST